MATSTYGTPYVQGSDLVSAYPTASSNLATRVDEVSYKRNGLNAQTGTTYTLVAGDAGKTITLSNASPVAVTLPQDSTADLPDGAVVTFYNLGAGAVTISQGTGATLQGGSISLAQYEVTSVIKLSANTYGRFDGCGAAGLAVVAPSSIANSGGTSSLTGTEVTFTTVNTVSLNGVFTSTHKSYRIICNITAAAAGAYTNMRLRASGTDNSSSNYRWHYFYGNYTGAATVNGLNSAGLTTSFAVGYLNNPGGGAFALDIMGPQATQYTSFYGRTQNLGTDAGGSTGDMSVTTSYDGFTLLAASGTMTGTVTVFGYKA